MPARCSTRSQTDASTLQWTWVSLELAHSPTALRTSRRAFSTVAGAGPDVIQVNPGGLRTLVDAGLSDSVTVALRLDVTNVYEARVGRKSPGTPPMPTPSRTPCIPSVGCVVLNLLELDGNSALQEQCVSNIQEIGALARSRADFVDGGAIGDVHQSRGRHFLGGRPRENSHASPAGSGAGGRHHQSGSLRTHGAIRRDCRNCPPPFPSWFGVEERSPPESSSSAPRLQSMWELAESSMGET